MTGRGEQDLGQRVDRALATITSGPVPAAAIVARGRAIRRRRRLAGAAAVVGAAAVTAVAVALPGLLFAVGHPKPPAGQLTINSLGPVARDGVIGSGRTGGKSWTVRLAGGPNPVAQATGVPGTSRLGTMPAGSDPAALHAGGSGALRLLAGPVSPQVAYLAMRLAGGTTYRLSPVAWHGHRYVALVVPWNLQVTRFTAYSRHGELAFAIPFPVAREFPRVVSWLRAGTPVPAVASATVGHGVDRYGGFWSVQVQIGPWGTCLQDNGGYFGTWCRPTVSYPPNALTLVMSSPYLSERAGITGRAVAYIQLRLRNGKTARLHVLHIGGQGFYALSVLTGPPASWTAYTTTGHPIATGTGTPG